MSEVIDRIAQAEQHCAEALKEVQGAIESLEALESSSDDEDENGAA